MNNRLTYLRRLQAHLNADADTLAIDLIAGELLHSVIAAASGGHRYRSSRLDWYARRIDAIEGIACSYSDSWFDWRGRWPPNLDARMS